MFYEKRNFRRNFKKNFSKGKFNRKNFYKKKFSKRNIYTTVKGNSKQSKQGQREIQQKEYCMYNCKRK